MDDQRCVPPALSAPRTASDDAPTPLPSMPPVLAEQLRELVGCCCSSLHPLADDEVAALWEQVAGGHAPLAAFCDDDTARLLVVGGERPAGALSPREQQVVTRALAGVRGRAIASELGLSPGRVSHHLRSARRKLAAASRSSL